MKFPEWAPQKLVEYYLNHYFDESMKEGIRHDVLYQLITKSKMQATWKMLHKQSKSKYFSSEVMAFRLFVSICNAVFESRKKVITRGDDALKKLEIAKVARAFVKAVKGSALDKNPHEWFSLTAINSILENDIKPEKLEGYFCLIQDENQFHKKGGIYSEFHFKDLDGNHISEYLPIAKNTKEMFNQCIITPQYPIISVIIEKLAKDADKLAKDAMTKHRNVERPSIGKTTIFIRSLYSNFWFEAFGTPLYGTFAGLCEVVFDDSSISRDTIINALKGYKLPENKDLSL